MKSKVNPSTFIFEFQDYLGTQKSSIRLRSIDKYQAGLKFVEAEIMKATQEISWWEWSVDMEGVDIFVIAFNNLYKAAKFPNFIYYKVSLIRN
jgi:hypothetical protein